MMSWLVYYKCLLLYCGLKKEKNHHKEICLKKGEIGSVEQAFEKLNILENKKVSIIPAEKPKSLEYIKKKFNGEID